MASCCNVDDFSFCLSCFLASVFHVVVPTVSMICFDVSPMSMICLMVNSIELESAVLGQRGRKRFGLNEPMLPYK